MSLHFLTRVAAAMLAPAFVVLHASTALAAAGALDGNFDGDGKVTTSFSGFAWASGGVRPVRAERRRIPRRDLYGRA